MWKVQLSELNYDQLETEAVLDVLNSRWLTMGQRTNMFESSFSRFLGLGIESIAVSNCTAALSLALMAVGVVPGDEVVIPALTFVADANAVRLAGATPVLADCASMDDWNVSASTIERALTPRTRAVIVVHYAGYPCDMEPIVRLCKDRGLKLIEDVAHAPGASVSKRACGAWGDVGCFSFFSNKNLSVGEGGMLTTTDHIIAKRLRLLRSHGMTTLTLDRHLGRAVSYDVAEPGTNSRMDEIRAALGLVQLEKLPSGNAKRGQLTDRYRKNLVAASLSIPFSHLPYEHISAYHILPVLLPAGADRLNVMAGLKSRGVQSSIHYPDMRDFSAYRSSLTGGELPVTTEVCRRELTLPLFPSMTFDAVDFVCASLLECL